MSSRSTASSVSAPPAPTSPSAPAPTAGRPTRSLRARLRMAFGLLSLLVVAVAAVAFWGFTQLNAFAHHAVDVDGNLSRLANRVAVSALQVRRYEREYFLDIADPSLRNHHLQRWQQVSGDLYIALNNLEVAVDSEADQQLVREWQAAYSTYRKGFDRVRLEVETGAITEPEAASAALDPTRENIARVTDMAVELAERKNASAQQTADNLDRESGRMIWQLVIAGAAAIAIAVGWSLVFPSRLTRPIAALSGAAERLSGGDLAVRVPVERRDELGVLAASFNQMAATIQRQLVDLEEQNAAARAARDAAQAAEASIAAQLATIEAQRAVIGELSVPILPLTASTLVVPLVGALDSARMQQMVERALEAVERSAARYLILDVTGVPVVDTQVAGGLLRLTQAVRLLGARVVLVGIRPEVAQAVVSLGVGFDDMVTRSTLQSGIEYTVAK